MSCDNSVWKEKATAYDASMAEVRTACEADEAADSQLDAAQQNKVSTAAAYEQSLIAATQAQIEMANEAAKLGVGPAQEGGEGGTLGR